MSRSDANTKDASPNQFSKGMARLKSICACPECRDYATLLPPSAHKSPPFLGKIIKWRGLLPISVADQFRNDYLLLQLYGKFDQP